MAGAATLWCIARDVEEFTFLITSRACLWQHGGSKDKSTLTAFPIGFMALGTDISCEPTVCGVSAVSTLISLFFILRSLRLLFFIRYCKISKLENLLNSTSPPNLSSFG